GRGLADSEQALPPTLRERLVLQLRLTTARLELVPLAEEHLPSMIELNTDPAVLRYLLPRPMTVPQIQEMHRVWLARGARGDGLGIWAGRASSEFIGIWM